MDHISDGSCFPEKRWITVSIIKTAPMQGLKNMLHTIRAKVTTQVEGKNCCTYWLTTIEGWLMQHLTRQKEKATLRLLLG